MCNGLQLKFSQCTILFHLSHVQTLQTENAYYALGSLVVQLVSIFISLDREH